jgi:Zn-finger nucleic acid-binding protein
MKCPVCDVELKMADRQGVEIDYCPKCRGVWLDRGELDKIIEKSSSFREERREESSEEREPRRERRDDDFDERDPRRRRRKGFLGEFFDLG